MRNHISIFVVLVAVLVGAGCSKKSNPVEPSSGGDFPSSSKFSVTLYSVSTSAGIGQSFEVKVILYNVTNVAGYAMKISYQPSTAEVDSISLDSPFVSPDSSIGVSLIEPDSGRVSFGVARRYAGTPVSVSGSGVVCTLWCRGKGTGTCNFVIDPVSLEIQTPDGVLIQGFASLLIENLAIAIH